MAELSFSDELGSMWQVKDRGGRVKTFQVEGRAKAKKWHEVGSSAG